MLSSLNAYNFSAISNKINEATKTINRNGLENTTENLFHKLRNDEIQGIKDIELKGISAAENKYGHYDNIMKEMRTVLNDFRLEMIKKNNDTQSQNSTDAINITMDGLKKSFQRLADTKIDGEKMFDHYSELLIGDSMRVPRTYDKDFIKVNGANITDILQSFIDSQKPNLDEMDTISDTLGLKQAEIGARWNGVKSTKALYENTKLTENEFMSKRYKLVEAIQDLNNLTLTYEALSKTIARISSLSLVNYI